jgi:hypothetical protein
MADNALSRLQDENDRHAAEDEVQEGEDVGDLLHG